MMKSSAYLLTRFSFSCSVEHFMWGLCDEATCVWLPLVTFWLSFFVLSSEWWRFLEFVEQDSWLAAGRRTSKVTVSWHSLESRKTLLVTKNNITNTRRTGNNSIVTGSLSNKFMVTSILISMMFKLTNSKHHQESIKSPSFKQKFYTMTKSYIIALT